MQTAEHALDIAMLPSHALLSGNLEIYLLSSFPSTMVLYICCSLDSISDRCMLISTALTNAEGGVGLC